MKKSSIDDSAYPEFAWYRVVGWGCSGMPRRSPDEAWASFFRQAGLPGSEHGTATAAHSARLIGATTRRAAMDADVSAGSGKIGRGEWEIVPN